MSRKLIGLLVVALLLALPLAGCQSAAPTAAPTPSPTVAATVEPTVAPTEAAPTSVTLNGTLIANLVVPEEGKEGLIGFWSVKAGFKVGDPLYGDRKYTVAKMPGYLSGAEFISPSIDSEWSDDPKFIQATFEVTADVDVYVITKTNNEGPAPWFKDFASTGDILELQEADSTSQYAVYKKAYAKGSKIEVGVYDPSTQGYGNVVIAVKPAGPAALNGILVKNLVVPEEKGEELVKFWSIKTGLKVGDPLYGDRKYGVAKMPDYLNGAEYISPSIDSEWSDDPKFIQATFEVSEDVNVYVISKTGYEGPAPWMEGFESTGDMLELQEADSTTQYAIYKKNYAKGSKIEAGVYDPSIQGPGNIVIAVQPAAK